MKSNVLLRKNHTGKPRAAVIALPNSSHRFGRPPKNSETGVASCLQWAGEPPAAGVQAKRGLALPSDENPHFVYGKAGAAHEDLTNVLAQTAKKRQLAAARAKENAFQALRARERSVARLPGKTTRPTRTQRAVDRGAPRPLFTLKRFQAVPAKVQTRRLEPAPRAPSAMEL